MQIDSTRLDECKCTRTWVLVVHNSFKGVANYERIGNDFDVSNLRRAFSTQRQCRFAELADRCSADILRALSDEQRFVQLFHPEDDYEPLCCQPEVLLLFVLTHGEKGGVILSDHLLQGCDQGNPKFDSYTTQDMWNGLSSLEVLNKIPKVIFLASCRGELKEWKIAPETAASPPPAFSSWISAKPNAEDFILFYATIESFSANRHEQFGTWFVQEICHELDQIEREEELLSYLIKVQHNLCKRLLVKNNESGQTPQLHMFCHRKISICGAHPKIRPTSKIKLDIDGPKRLEEDSDFAPRNPLDVMLEVDTPTKKEDLIERHLFYSWSKSSNLSFRRGKAFVFYDDRHAKYTSELATTFQQLQYKTTIGSLRDIEADTCNIFNILSNTKSAMAYEHLTAGIFLRQGFFYDGSLILCILAELEETSTGLCYKNENQFIPLSAVVDRFCGQKCLALIGKPKIFFFLDEGSRTDGKTQEHELAFSDLQFSNAHAGCCVFVGVGKGKTNESIILDLCKELQSPELNCLQESLIDLINASGEDKSNKGESAACVKSQMMSTLPVFVNFPPLKNVHHPKLYTHSRFHLLILGIVVIFLAAVLGGLLTAWQENTMFMVFENDSSCKVKFSNSEPAPERNALLLDAVAWKWKVNNCWKIWGKNYRFENKIMILISLNRTPEAIADLTSLNSSAAKPEHVLSIVALIHYSANSDNLDTMLQFASQLPNENWRFQTFNVLYGQMIRFDHHKRAELFSLAFYLSKETNKAFANMKSKVEKEQDKIVENVCIERNSVGTRISRLSEEVRRNVLPKIISACFKTLKTGAVRKLLNPITKMPSTACLGYQLLFENMKKIGSLKSTDAYIVRALSNEASQNSFKFNDIEKCQMVTESKHFNTSHYKTFLALCDAHEWKYVRIYNLTHYLPLLVKQEYSAHTDNLNTLTQLLWGDYKFLDAKCIGSLPLVVQIKKFGQLATVEGIALLSNVKRYGDFNQTGCKNIRNLVPEWLKVFLFEQPTTCKFTENENCSNEFAADLEVFLSDGKKRYLQVRNESLFVYFVLCNQNKSVNCTTTANDWSRDLADAVVTNYQVMQLDSLDKKFSKPFLRFAHKFAAECLYKSKNKDSIELALHKFNTLSSVEDVCMGIDYFYQEMERSSDLHSIQAFFLYLYADFVVQSISYNSSTFPKDATAKVVQCSLVLNTLSKYNKKLMDTYFSSWQTSISTVEDWHSNYFSAFWVLPGLVKIALEDTFRDKNETVLKLGNFISSVLTKNKLFTCPGLLSLRNIIEEYKIIDKDNKLKTIINNAIKTDSAEKFVIEWEDRDKVINFLQSFCNKVIRIPLPPENRTILSRPW